MVQEAGETSASLNSPQPRKAAWNQYKSACIGEEEVFDELAVVKVHQRPLDVNRIGNVERVYVHQYLKKVRHREDTAVALCRQYRDELIKVRQELHEQKLKLEIADRTLELEKEKLRVQCQ